jgi:hypothetical protein
MTGNNRAACVAANGSARPDGRIEPDPIPTAMLAERPPGELWALTGVPPCGPWALMRPTETVVGWLVVCPACVQGWCRLLPDPVDAYDYQLELAAGCSRGCDPGEIAWWLMWRLGEVPPQEPIPPDKRELGYARGVVRNALATARAKPKSAAFKVAQWCRSAAINPDLALAAVATAAGVPAATLHQAFQAGLAAPAKPRLRP